MLKKTVIITGAAGGIGTALAYKFAMEDYNLALTYHNAQVDELIINIKKEFDVEVKAYKLDISSEAQVQKVFAKIFADFEYVDCLVANAGMLEKETMLIDKSLQEIKAQIDVNLLGAILCNREALKYFVKQKHGNIVNISSIHGEQGASCNAVYSACKAGVIGLTQSLAKEVGALGIRVNAITPGCIDTPMTAGYTKAERKEIVKQIPLGHIGYPIDVANAAVFLASTNAEYITGAAIPVNGGAVNFE